MRGYSPHGRAAKPKDFGLPERKYSPQKPVNFKKRGPIGKAIDFLTGTSRVDNAADPLSKINRNKAAEAATKRQKEFLKEVNKTWHKRPR